MVLVLTFILNAGLNFAIGLVLAAVLGPDAYGLYAVGATAATVLATALFEWLRLSTTRFYGSTSDSEIRSTRATLDRAYGIAGITLIVGSVLVAAVSPRLGLPRAFLGAICVGALANGAFDYASALARARFHNRAYTVLVVGKGLLALGCALLAARLCGGSASVLAAQAAGTGLALLPVRAMLRDRGLERPRFDRLQVGRWARYALPVVVANALLQGVILLNRSVAASVFGYAAAGQLALATDLPMRLLLAAGAALDVLLFQLAVRIDAEHGRAAAEAQLRINMIVVASVLALLAVTFTCTMPAFTALIVPMRYREAFPPLASALVPGIALLCFTQFGLNPVFQLAHRTLPLIIGAVSTLIADAIGLLVLRQSGDVAGIAWVHSVSLGLGCVIIATKAFTQPSVRPPLHDLAFVGLAALATGCALTAIPARLPPIAVLALAALLSPAVFGAVLVVGNVAGLQALALARATRIMRPERRQRPA